MKQIVYFSMRNDNIKHSCYYEPRGMAFTLVTTASCMVLTPPEYHSVVY